MTFWDWWESNRQKTWGQTVIVASVLGMMLQAGAGKSFLSATTIDVLIFVCLLVIGISGGGTTKAAFANTTRERVAESMATVAVAEAKTAEKVMEAVHTPPPPAAPGD